MGKHDELAMKITDAVCEKIDEMLEMRCYGKKVCTAHRAVLAWTIRDILEAASDHNVAQD